MTIKAILFDHDGTLVDSEPEHYQLWADVLRSHGLALSQADYAQYYAGVPCEQNAQDLVARYALSVAPETLSNAKHQVTRRYLESSAFVLMPGAEQVVQNLAAQGLRLAVATGATRHGLLASQREHAVFRHFDALVSRDEVLHSKPAPDVYLLAMQRLGVTADECIAIEDTGTGVQAAVAAGVRCIAIPTPLSRQHDFSRAACQCDSLLSAQCWIDAQLSAST